MLKNKLSLSIESCNNYNLLSDILSKKITDEFKKEMEKLNNYSFSFSEPFKPDNEIIKVENIL